jgi:hypothetical protein
MLTALLWATLAQADVSTMSRFELQEEIDRLEEEERPTYTPPLGLMAGGGAVIGAAIVYGYSQLTSFGIGHSPARPFCDRGGIFCSGGFSNHTPGDGMLVVAGIGATMVITGALWLLADFIVSYYDSPRLLDLKVALQSLTPPRSPTTR